MSKKATVPLKIAPLQGVIAEPITDSAEQAAFDELRKRPKRKQEGQKVKQKRDDNRAALNPTAKKGD
jgi:hypothetical protein